MLPALFFFIAVQMTYSIVTHAPWKIERAAIVSIIFYFWNWRLYFTYPAVPKGLAHLWSLSVEEQFYMVWPLVVALFVVARRRASTVITAMAAAIAAIAVWRYVLAEHANLLLLYFRTDVRADALLVGALAAYLWTRGYVPPSALPRSGCVARARVRGLVRGPVREHVPLPVQRRFHRVRTRGGRHAARDRRGRLALEARC